MITENKTVANPDYVRVDGNFVTVDIIPEGKPKKRIVDRPRKLYLITSESALRFEGTRPKVDTVLFDGAPAFLEKTRAEWWIGRRLFQRPKDTPKLFVTEVSLDFSRSPAPPFSPHNPLKEPIAT